MSYEKLEAYAKQLGYSHVSVEFCEQMRESINRRYQNFPEGVLAEYLAFMEGMRALLAPRKLTTYDQNVRLAAISELIGRAVALSDEPTRLLLLAEAKEQIGEVIWHIEGGK